MGIGVTIERIQKEHPNKIAITTNDCTVSYKELYEQIRLIQQHLIEYKGSGKGKKVGILLGNEPEFLPIFFAVVTLGWVAIPFDPKWSQTDIDYVLSVAKPEILIGDESFVHRDEQMISVWELLQSKVTNHTISWEHHEKELFYIGFTSGSTGTPKGFKRNHQSWIKSFKVAEEAFQYTKDDTIIAPGPLCHSLSLFAAIHALHIGATFYLLPKFRAEEVLEIIKDKKANVFYVVPTMIQALLKHVQEKIEVPFKLLSSGAKLSSALLEKMENAFPQNKLFEYYGASELSFVAYSTKAMRKQNSYCVGKPFPNVSIYIEKEDGTAAKVNEIGEVIVQSELIFSGYVNNPTETAAVLTRSGAKIGDLGYFDENGLLTIIGRKKNMIITGGLNVYPEEVEAVMKEVNEVEEAVVIGIRDEYWGEKVIAFVQWKKGAKEQDLSTIQAHCKQRLTSFKCPKQFFTLKEIPYTSTGKIARKQLEAFAKGVMTT